MTLSKKCLVLDLDNTLWGGIVGEDGFDGIRIGPTPDGRPFWEFQQYILALFHRGVILAVNSRNNPEDALRVLREHPHMILKEDNFSSLKINWEDKASNLKAIAGELNIGLDSMVFIDDDMVNRELVRHMLPEVTVIDLPDDPAFYLDTLAGADYFNVLQITEEDRIRSVSYAQERKREEFKKSAGLEDYIAALQTEIRIGSANSFSISRIAQLTQRTNQFNMTTRRYLEKDIQDLSERKDSRVFSFSLKDKFGDYGIVGAAIIRISGETWRIDTFLMSCRVLGRRAEEGFLSCILGEAKKKGAKSVEGVFIPSQKNAVAGPFYQKSGFQLASQKEGQEIWTCDLSKEYEIPACLRIDRKGTDA